MVANSVGGIWHCRGWRERGKRKKQTAPSESPLGSKTSENEDSLANSTMTFAYLELYCVAWHRLESCAIAGLSYVVKGWRVRRWDGGENNQCYLETANVFDMSAIVFIVCYNGRIMEELLILQWYFVYKYRYEVSVSCDV